MTLALVLAAALTADFGTEVGKMRPALHSSGFGPTICSQTPQDLADVKSMGFAYARTHDWAGINTNQRVCDYFHLFTLMKLDAKDPSNYVFGPTDYLLKRTREEAGLDVFFRLGTTIEHSGDKIHFNSVRPDDFEKMAEIFAATVRHYNRGWASGYRWNIRCWEIWNEPEGYTSMWCPPEGTEGLKGAALEAKCAELRASFVKSYPVLCACTSAGSVTTLAVKSAEGARKALLVVDYGGVSRRVEVDVAGAAKLTACTLLDDKHDLTPVASDFKDGTLQLTKPDFHSAAFLTEFE